jgi:4-hydroxysphinganine ceramide fatty acyl 2-hydroxylase
MRKKSIQLWPWWLAPIVWVPMSIILFIYAYSSFNTSIFMMIFLLFLGLIFWTLIEYLTHRFILHYEGKNNFINNLAHKSHKKHHENTQDPYLIIIEPPKAIILGGIAYLLLLLIFGFKHSLFIMSGFSLGYSIYESAHFSFHHLYFQWRWFKILKGHHLRHHFSSRYKNKRYGVTNRIWDKIFRTLK